MWQHFFGSFQPLTVSREAEAWRSGRKPTSNMWSRKAWSSMPYTRSRKSTIEALWSGQKQADMSGSVTVPSEIERIEGVKGFRLTSRLYRIIPLLTSYLSHLILCQNIPGYQSALRLSLGGAEERVGST